MDKTNINYYYESGIATPVSIFLVFVSSVLVLILISFFYSLGISHLPIIYFNFLLAIGFGFSISFISRIFNIVFKIRNRKKTIIITIILAVIAIYLQWVSYFFILQFKYIDFNVYFENIRLFFHILSRPDLVISELIDVSRIGLWGIGSSGINVKGLVLWLIWIVEAGIIFFIAWNNFRQFNILPFSEKDNKWFKKEIIDFDFEHIAFKKKFVEAFEINPMQVMSELNRGDGLRHSKITMYTSDTETKNIITIDNIIITERGKGKKDVTNVLKLCYVDNIFSSQIRTKYKTKKASIFDQ